MIEKERLISELNVKSLETKNENKWNEQTIIDITPFFHGIINFPLDKLDDTMLCHIKTIIESMVSLDKTARKHLEENTDIYENKDIWDILFISTRMEQNSLYLAYVIFYSDFTFRLKYRVSGNCKENICPKDYFIGFNFTKDLTLESVFSEIFPIHIHFDLSGYLLTIPPNGDKSFKFNDIEGIIEEISIFNGKYQQCADDDLNEQNYYARCPQNKAVCITISFDKLRPHYKAHAKYAHKNISVNPANLTGFCFCSGMDVEVVGVLRTNNIYPIRWLKKHNQENSGIISIPVKNKENFYINCEIQNYEIRKMEIIEDADICRKLESGIFKEDKL